MIQFFEKSQHRPASTLQQELIGQIAALVHEGRISVGDRLTETGLAKMLNVSRTPVRAALRQLEIDGLVERVFNQGARLVAVPPRVEQEAVEKADDALLMRIASDRRDGILEPEISETGLMKTYGLSRKTIRLALERLSELDVVEQKPGYGWRFVGEVQDSESREESYRYRLVIEVSAIMEPTFALDREWASEIRRRHEKFLEASWTEFSSIEFFEMNADFHEGLCAASGNRFMLDGVRKQNQLRRLSNYDWRYGQERVAINSREHLEILDRLESGDREFAAFLMRRHLEGALQVRRPDTNSLS